MTDQFDRAEDRETYAFLERALPRVRPPDDLLDRILLIVQPGANVIALGPHRSLRWLLPAGAVAALAAAAVVLVAVLAGDKGLGAPDARAAISGKSDPAVHGDAKLYDAGSTAGKVLVTLREVPPAPSDHHYEVWVLRKGVTEMEAVGSFTPSSSTVELELPLPGPGDYAAVDISVEENGGSPTHSGTSLAGGAFS